MKIYFCGNALAKQINITSESSSFGHKKYTFEKEVFLWPEHFNKTSISPQTFLAHKKKQGIEKLIIISKNLIAKILQKSDFISCLVCVRVYYP